MITQPLKMNEFYDIGIEGQTPTNPLQLKNYGAKRTSSSISTSTMGTDGERKFHMASLTRETKPKDYDLQFIDYIYKSDPPYNVDHLLDHHYNNYVVNDPEKHKLFIRHIKYAIIPFLKDDKKHAVYIDLITEWLKEKTQFNDTNNPSLIMQNAEFSNKDQTALKENKVSIVIPENNIFKKKDTMSEVFISYSWDTKEHEAKVVAFTEHLRKRGFNAQLDKMLSQKETATNFIKMMHLAMLEHPKVIVVLSAGYKTKAETFKGGVGEEYQLLLTDISKSPTKYILVSFEGRSDDIIPFGLQGREIIDLSSEGGEEKLFRKLMDENAYIFSPVGAEKPKLSPLKIEEFELSKAKYPVSIEQPSILKGDISSTGGLYKFVEFQLILNFKNLSTKSMEGFAYELKIVSQLVPDSNGNPISEGHYIFSESISQKVFPNQTVKSKAYNIKISSHSKHQAIGSIVTVTVYTDQGQETKSFETDQLFKIPPTYGHYGDPVPLSKEMFL